MTSSKARMRANPSNRGRAHLLMLSVRLQIHQANLTTKLVPISNYSIFELFPSIFVLVNKIKFPTSTLGAFGQSVF